MEDGNLRWKLMVKEMELNSLFETIKAINANASEESLYKILKFTISSNPAIAEMVIFEKEDSKWFFREEVGVEESYQNKRLVYTASDSEVIHKENLPLAFQNFHTCMPILHKDQLLALIFLTFRDTELDKHEEVFDFIEALGNIILVAIENKKLFRKQQKQLDYQRQLDVAGKVQSALFPKNLPYQKSLKVFASYLPHHAIGGDYYDYIAISEDIRLFCIADVSGKGIPAALLMSNFQASLRILCRQHDDLGTVVDELNRLLMLNSEGENFITAFFFKLNLKDKSAEYINAGHNPPFLVTADTELSLEKGTTILGAFDELLFLEKGFLALPQQFLLFCFTDGFSETYDEHGEEFGEEQLLEEVKLHQEMELPDLHASLIKTLNKYKGELKYIDDITLLSVKCDLS